MSKIIHNELQLATAEFLAAKLWEHATWTNEKRAVFCVLRKYLIHVGANIVYKNSMNSLSTLGSSVYVSNLKGWFPDAFVKSGTAEMRILIGHRDKSGENNGKQFAILKLHSYSSEKQLDYSKKLYAHREAVIHDLWFKDELPIKLWNALLNHDKNNLPLEFSRADEGIGASWYGTEITGDESLDFELYSKLESTAIEMQDLGGMYPGIKLRFLTSDLISVTVIR